MKATFNYNNKDYELDYEILAPGIYVYHNALPEDMNIINRIENALSIPGTRFNWKQAGLGYGDTNLEHRRCKDFKIKDDILLPRDEYSSDILDLWSDIILNLKACLSHYCPPNYLNGVNYFECINVVKYGAGEYFKVHTDDGDPYRCTVSCVGYPNDNYEGGELAFPLFNVKYKPKAGDFVISPAAYVYAHSAEPITDEGIKYSLVVMTDRNEFAHRADSPIYNPEERKKYGL